MGVLKGGCKSLDTLPSRGGVSIPSLQSAGLETALTQWQWWRHVQGEVTRSPPSPGTLAFWQCPPRSQLPSQVGAWPHGRTRAGALGGGPAQPCSAESLMPRHSIRERSHVQKLLAPSHLCHPDILEQRQAAPAGSCLQSRCADSASGEGLADSHR